MKQPAVGGFSISDHGQMPLARGRWRIRGYAAGSDTRLYYSAPAPPAVARKFRGLACMVEEKARCWQWLFHAEAAALKLAARYDDVPVEKRPIILGRVRFPKSGGMVLETNSIERAVQGARFFAARLGPNVVAMRCRVINRCFAADEGAPGHRRTAHSRPSRPRARPGPGRGTSGDVRPHGGRTLRLDAGTRSPASLARRPATAARTGSWSGSLLLSLRRFLDRSDSSFEGGDDGSIFRTVGGSLAREDTIDG